MRTTAVSAVAYRIPPTHPRRVYINLAETTTTTAPAPTMSAFADALRFFLETSSLEKDPESTLGERVLMLRILYSILSIDVPIAVAHLRENGVFVGQHDAKHTLNVHHEQRLTVMDAAATYELLGSIERVEWDDLVAELQAVYADAPSRSPLLTLKRAFEEAVGAPGARAAVFVQVFCGPVFLLLLSTAHFVTH